MANCTDLLSDMPSLTVNSTVGSYVTFIHSRLHLLYLKNTENIIALRGESMEQFV